MGTFSFGSIMQSIASLHCVKTSHPRRESPAALHPRSLSLRSGYLSLSFLPHTEFQPTLPTSHSKITEPATSVKANGRRYESKPLFSEGRDTDDKRAVCHGCGVIMQDRDPDLPGFYVKREIDIGEREVFEVLDEDDFINDQDEEDEDGSGDVYGENTLIDEKEIGFSARDEVDWDSDWEFEDEEWRKNLDGFSPVGAGYGNVTEEVLKKKKREKVSKTERKKQSRERGKKEEAENMSLVCARCHSLRNYGHVKNQNLETLMPDFDFNQLIATRLMKTRNLNDPVVVMVVDCVDFDGSFPKQVVKSLIESMDSKGSKFNTSPKLVLVGTKVDLLPSQISPTRLVCWARNRAKANGAPKLNGVHLVSSKKDLGIRNLLAFVKELAGPRGDVWVVGAQNAGKSTLINAFAKREGVRITRLTEAAVPGTTLGILRIKGILPANAKMYDTPGLLHPYLLSMRLNREEQKMVEIRKELQPRTYRMKAGQAVHIGALARLDLVWSSVETIYITVWASPNISLHLGKLENVEEIWRKHAGIRLQPPVGEDRVSELGEWHPREFKVSGVSWEVNSVDIAIAGLGWISIGLKGEATVSMWTYDGVEVIIREPLVLDRASFVERSGFWLPKAISEAIGNRTKLEAKKREAGKTREEHTLVENIFC